MTEDSNTISFVDKLKANENRAPEGYVTVTMQMLPQDAITFQRRVDNKEITGVNNLKIEIPGTIKEAHLG